MRVAQQRHLAAILTQPATTEKQQQLETNVRKSDSSRQNTHTHTHSREFVLDLSEQVKEKQFHSRQLRFVGVVLCFLLLLFTSHEPRPEVQEIWQTQANIINYRPAKSASLQVNLDAGEQIVAQPRSWLRPNWPERPPAGQHPSTNRDAPRVCGDPPQNTCRVLIGRSRNLLPFRARLGWICN